jgi:hypothetical protein
MPRLAEMDRCGRQPAIGELRRQLAECVQRTARYRQSDHHVLNQQPGIHENNLATW